MPKSEVEIEKQANSVNETTAREVATPQEPQPKEQVSTLPQEKEVKEIQEQIPQELKAEPSEEMPQDLQEV